MESFNFYLLKLYCFHGQEYDGLEVISINKPYKPLRFVQKTSSFVIQGNNSMRRLFAVVLAICLWSNFAPSAKALGADLIPCSESSVFHERAATARNTTADPMSGEKRFKRYSQALCGPEGLPHLIVDGRWEHAGDFVIPGLMFLYIAGWIGWVGRAYLIAIRGSKDAEQKEIQIDIRLALPIILSGFAWPAAAIQELLSGSLTAKESEITVSPR
ncbi:photosystem I subunit III precursor, plastocyanin (cyt c553) docking protein (PsaF) [Richelia intracellularis HH01]|uniref:Photosystem I reaction center subunit III n=2 Tax=Richelia TaxID=98443 RepID=M1WZ14_9NOST|nr:photosystem I subunit III precursor, plastocyanin (cyt c553) docking protein (PsaF) [Richelia intracellularis HH01]